MNTLVAGLEAGCVSCGMRLHLSSPVGERRYGLASIFYIKCCDCNATTSIATSGTHWTTESKCGRPAYSVNTKATLGMINAGIGATNLNAVLTTMNIPAWHHKPMKARERSIGVHIESVAKSSCVAAVQKERDLWAKSQSSAGNVTADAQHEGHDGELCLSCKTKLDSVILQQC